MDSRLQVSLYINQTIIPQHRNNDRVPSSTVHLCVKWQHWLVMAWPLGFFSYWMTKDKGRQTESLLKRRQVKHALLGTEQAPRKWILAWSWKLTARLKKEIQQEDGDMGSINVWILHARWSRHRSLEFHSQPSRKIDAWLANNKINDHAVTEHVCVFGYCTELVPVVRITKLLHSYYYIFYSFGCVW